jgi:hypothetical protein
LVRLNYGNVIEHRNNPGGATGVIKWKPVCTDFSERDSALCPTGNADHWDLELPIGTVMKLIIHTSRLGLITMPEVDTEHPDAILTPVELLQAEGLDDEALSIHYKPPFHNGDNIGDIGTSHVSLFWLRTAEGTWMGEHHTWVGSGDVSCEAFHLSDVDWGSDLWVGRNMLPAGPNVGRVGVQYNEATAEYELRAVRAASGGGLKVEETATSIDISIDPAYESGVLGGTASFNVYCYGTLVYTQSWVNGRVQNNEDVEIDLADCCCGASSSSSSSSA